MGMMGNGQRIFVQKPEGKRQVGRSRCRQKDSIKMDPEEIGLERCELESYGSGYGLKASLGEYLN